MDCEYKNSRVIAYDYGYKDGANAGYKLAKADVSKKAEKLWDGITDIIPQEQIETIERLYKAELVFILDE